MAVERVSDGLATLLIAFCTFRFATVLATIGPAALCGIEDLPVLFLLLIWAVACLPLFSCAQRVCLSFGLSLRLRLGLRLGYWLGVWLPGLEDIVRAVRDVSDSSVTWCNKSNIRRAGEWAGDHREGMLISLLIDRQGRDAAE
jgi:hypothetical protein